MTDLSDFFRIARPQQWYKNLLVFLPIIFVARLFEKELFVITVIGFIALCFISSANYIINDIIDAKKDRMHPERKTRPIASGSMPIWQAIILVILLATAAALLAIALSKQFFYSILLLFILTLLYSLWLKHEIFADIIIIGINFVLRAISGAFIIDVRISPWLIIGVFFFAIFLAIGKRHAELLFLGTNAAMHRITLKQYTKELTSALMILTTSLLVMAYALYSFFSEHKNLFFTMPFAMYAIFRYFQLIYSGSALARHPELTFTDLRMILAMALWAVVTFYLLFFAS